MKKITVLFSLLLFFTSAQGKQWTTIRLGIEPAYPPFSMKTADGKLTGFDADVANALCVQMRAKCTFVESDFDALLAGLNVLKFDAVISALTITAERKKMVSFSEPYYQTPTRIVAKLGAIDGTVASLHGKKLGVLQGSVQHWYARDTLAGAGVTVIPYTNQNEVFLDLKSGRVDAVIADVIQAEYSFLKRPESKGFGFVGPVIESKRYFSEGFGIAFRKTDDDLRIQFDQALQAIRANGVYKKIQDKYLSHDFDKNENTYSYTSTIFKGLQTTLVISLASLVLAMILGLVFVLMRMSTNRWANGFAAVYSTVIRGVPDLVLMLLLFYGGQSLLNQLMEAMGYDGHLEISAAVAGVLTVGFIFGAYMGETFRGALMAIPPGQSEAGYACGLGLWQVFYYIRLPQMVRFALPGIINNWLVLVKTTALVSVIGLQDMMYQAKRAGEATAQPFSYILIVAGLYLLITTLSMLILRAIGQRYSAGVKGIEQ